MRRSFFVRPDLARPAGQLLSNGPLALQWAMTLGLAGGLLWLVSTGGTGGVGQVVIHLAEADTEVRVGPVRFRVQEVTNSPVVVDLPAGRHEFLVRRRGEEIQRETFDLPEGISRVFTTYDHRTYAPRRPVPLEMPGRPIPTIDGTPDHPDEPDFIDPGLPDSGGLEAPKVD